MSYSRSETKSPDNRIIKIKNSSAYNHINKSQEVRSQHPSKVINYAKDEATNKNLENYFIDV